MKIDRRDKGKGKSTDLVLLSSKTNKNILCADINRKHNIRNIAKNLGVEIPEVITASQVYSDKVMGDIEGVLIDDVESVLERLILKQVDVVTTSSEVINKDKEYNYIKGAANSISELVDRKNKDYNNSFDKSIDKRGTDVYFIRIEDKLSRLENLLKSNKKPVINESIEDTMSDIIGYTLLMMNYLNKKGGTKNVKWGF